MQTSLQFDILPQPNLTTCGPTSLHAVYRFFGDHLPLSQVVQEIPQFEEGGTLAAILGCHALKRGYAARLYTFELQVFDPTWFTTPGISLTERLQAQLEVKYSKRLHAATDAFEEFLERGGEIHLEDLSSALIRRYLRRGLPILTGLSATYLYRERREYGLKCTPDDIRGLPSGHFVVLCGYDQTRREVLIADPLTPNPLATEQLYHVGLDRLKCAILLGIVTYDANLLIIEPRRPNPRRARSADSDCGG